MPKNTAAIADATEPVTIKVTMRDIAAATQADPTSCAIAQGAMRRNDIVSARIGARTARLTFRSGETLRYVLDTNSAKFVKAFDACGVMTPMSYTLLPPTPSVRLGARKGQTGSKVRTGRAPSIFKSPILRHISNPGEKDA